MLACPDSLGIAFGFLADPRGQTALALMPLWSGEIGEGAAVIEKMKGFGEPVMAEIHPQPYLETFFSRVSSPYFRPCIHRSRHKSLS